MNWLERARRELLQTVQWPTAITAERSPTAVTAVPHLVIREKSAELVDIKATSTHAANNPFGDGTPLVPETEQKSAAVEEPNGSELGEQGEWVPLDPSASTLLDSGIERRYACARALLAEYPNWRIAVVTEAVDPVIVGIAIRGIVYGELEIASTTYDPFALLKLIDKYGSRDSATLH
jgi:hypothetical protein